MKNTIKISNWDNVIDSRDVIARIEEFESMEGQMDALDCQEFDALRKLADECEDYSSDWQHGETLIRDDYFTSYIEELINDCYEMPKGLKSGDWPFRHMKMDYEAASEEAKQDYTSVSFDGVDYWIRSV